MDISLMRLVRTPHSEQYIVYYANEGVAQLDIHYDQSDYHATIVFFQDLPLETIATIMIYIEEQLVQNRDRFVVSIYSGQDISEKVAAFMALDDN